MADGAVHAPQGRIAPHNLEAEQSILGSMLLNEKCVFEAMEALHETDFHQQQHRNIFRAMDEMCIRDRDEVELVSNAYFDAQSIFINNTVRSGQRIECEGDIVVIGDVNPGGEVIAGGSIAVFGRLRGLAHAGCSGRKDV